jgi:hypothetical protein
MGLGVEGTPNFFWRKWLGYQRLAVIEEVFRLTGFPQGGGKSEKQKQVPFEDDKERKARAKAKARARAEAGPLRG